MGPFDADLLGKELRHKNDSVPDSVVRSFVVKTRAAMGANRLPAFPAPSFN